VLIVGGASPGAALAFLLTGPATNVTTFGILSDLHGKRAAILFAVSVGLGAIGCGYAVDATLAWSAIEVVPEISAHEHSAASEAQYLFLALITLLFVTSVFRTGPRPFLGQVFGIATDDGSGEDDSCCSSTAQKPEPSPGKG
jgi:MFS family permease